MCKRTDLIYNCCGDLKVMQVVRCKEARNTHKDFVCDGKEKLKYSKHYTDAVCENCAKLKPGDPPYDPYSKENSNYTYH